MRIGEVAARVGLRTSAIRYYESIGLLPSATRVSGRREYGAETVERLGLIQLAQNVGFTLDEVRELIGRLVPERKLSAAWREMAQQKLDELDASIRQLQVMKRLLGESLRCGCASARDCSYAARAVLEPRGRPERVRAAPPRRRT